MNYTVRIVQICVYYIQKLHFMLTNIIHYEQARLLAALALCCIARWESPICYRNLAGSSWVMLAVWTVPNGQHWLDGANIVYTGVCNTYANTDKNMQQQ